MLPPALNSLVPGMRPTAPSAPTPSLEGEAEGPADHTGNWGKRDWGGGWVSLCTAAAARTEQAQPAPLGTGPGTR